MYVVLYIYFVLFLYTGESKTGQRAKVTLVVVSTVLFAVFVAFCALLGIYLGSLRQGKIIHKMTCIIKVLNEMLFKRTVWLALFIDLFRKMSCL